MSPTKTIPGGRHPARAASVSDAVLLRGETQGAPAFVVNDWYITAYEPIRDPAGRMIGVLYVGLLQAPFAHQLHVISIVLGIVGAATVASLMLLLFIHAKGGRFVPSWKWPRRSSAAT